LLFSLLFLKAYAMIIFFHKVAVHNYLYRVK
jgi:hypothetical protein